MEKRQKSYALSFPQPSGATWDLAEQMAEADRRAAALRDAAKRDKLRARNENGLRHALVLDAERQAKLALETGWDARYRQFLTGPLEPWTSPDLLLGQRVYRDIMNRKPGADLLSSYGGAELAEVTWMVAEQLVIVPDRVHVVPLSDVDPDPGRRKYPGAPCTDEMARAGRQLRAAADELIIEAVRKLAVDGTLRAPAWKIAKEANRIKGKRPDLARCRYLSVALCQRRIRALIAGGRFIREAEPPRAVREGRSWKTIPRLLAYVGAAPRWRRGTPPAPGSRPSRRRRDTS